MSEDNTAEFDLVHERITAVETGMLGIKQDMVDLKQDTQEVVEWIRNGKLAGKVAAKSFSFLGRIILWLVKVIGAAAVLYAAMTSLKDGKFPDLRLWP